MVRKRDDQTGICHQWGDKARQHVCAPPIVIVKRSHELPTRLSKCAAVIFQHPEPLRILEMPDTCILKFRYSPRRLFVTAIVSYENLQLVVALAHHASE